MRLFIAIEIPASVKKELAVAQGRLRVAGVDASWSRAEGMHLTLKFLGEVTDQKVPEIMSSLQKAAEGIGPLGLSVSGIGAFPNPKNARVVWIGLAGDIEKLTRLQVAVENAMVLLNIAREERKFTPHLTLGRIKYIRSSDRWLKTLEEIKDISLPGFEVTSVSLMKSELKPSGAVYTEMGRAELQ
ncbi:MAG: RNA 2',3'-cyclic phosphodiesterase [Nitrospirae bacterium]|nr:RNA 2',3'-cyclic phosphodiesterase [Nitrospirota bacterium]